MQEEVALQSKWQKQVDPCRSVRQVSKALQDFLGKFFFFLNLTFCSSEESAMKLQALSYCLLHLVVAAADESCADESLLQTWRKGSSTSTNTFTGAKVQVKTSWKVDNAWTFRCLTFDATSKNVIATPCNGGDMQIWGVPTEGDRMLLVANDLCLAAVSAMTTNGSNTFFANVVLQDCDPASGAQQFKWNNDGEIGLGSTYRYHCMDWDVAGAYEKDNVYIHECNLQSNQKWFVELEVGRLQTQWKKQTTCLSVNQSLNAQGDDCQTANVVTWNKALNYSYIFVQLGSYDWSPKYCLTSESFRISDSDALNATLRASPKMEVVWDTCKKSYQKTYGDSQDFELTSKHEIQRQNHSELCLDWNVGGIFHRPNDVYLFGCNGRENQKWKFIPLEGSHK